MPRLHFDPETGWWSFPLAGEAESVVWIGEPERGPDDPPPPPYLPAELRVVATGEQAPGEPPPRYENDGAQPSDELRWDWYELAQAYARGEVEPLAEGEPFDPLAYQAAQACTVPDDHPPPGTIIGGPNVCPGTHCPSTPPNNWQSDNAVDIWLYPGTVVRSIAAGRVSTTYGYGYMGPPESQFGGSRLHVEHAGGLISFYTHLERITVAKGAHVRKGQAIGRSGFGNCVPHLHFAVNPPRDPRAYAQLTYDKNAPPNPPPPPSEPVEPPPKYHGRTPGQAWHNLMHAIGPDRRRQRQRLRAARRATRDALE